MANMVSDGRKVREPDMATQLERMREMERNGELEPIPELAAQ